MQEANNTGARRFLKCLFACFAISLAARIVYLVAAIPVLGVDAAMLVFEWQGNAAALVIMILVYPWVARRLR